MTDQSPRDALAFAIAKTIRPDMHDSRWRNFVRLTDTHPDDPEWAADLPVRQCRVIADAVLAWLAEPGQIETMAHVYMAWPKPPVAGETDEWEPDIWEHAIDRMRAAVAALRGEP